MGIIDEYLSLSKKYSEEYGEKTILLMQVGSFFEVYGLGEDDGSYSGSCISDFSKINEMMIAKKNMNYKGKQVYMAGFGVSFLEKNAKKLQENNYTIVVYTQDIQGKNTTRSLSEIISPGTYFSNEQQQLSNNITCIWIQRYKQGKQSCKDSIGKNHMLTMGISNVDIYTGRTSISQFDVEYFHNPCTYDELERYITVYKPSECIFVSNLEPELINDVYQYIGIDDIKIHNVYSGDKEEYRENTGIQKYSINAEKQIYQLKLFNQFYPNNEDLFHSSYAEHYIAIQSLTLLLDFIYQHSPHLINKLNIPIFDNYTNRLILANHSLKQLNILDDSRHTGKLKSVSSLLNNCETTMGKRRFIHILNNPITNIDVLNKIYNITDYLLKNNTWDNYRILLSNITDIERFSRKLVLKKTTPKGLSIFANDLKQTIKLYNLIKHDDTVLDYMNSTEPVINNNDITLISQEILNKLESTFDLDICCKIDDLSHDKLAVMEQNSTGFIKSGQSEKIDILRVQAFEGREKLESIRKYTCSIIKNGEKNGKVDTQYVKIHETAKTDPNLQTTQRRCSIFKNAIQKKLAKKEYEELSYKTLNGEEKVFNLPLKDFEYKNAGSSKTNMILTSPLISGLCNGLQNSKDKLVDEFIIFYETFIQDFYSFLSDIDIISRFITQLDIEQCRCYIAHKYNYCKPNVVPSQKSFFRVEGLRHPLIEHLQTQELYVTNDLEMGRDHNGMLLYGTNAVGKTSFIKSIGIAIIMAQSGLFVSASDFVYSPYTRIFTRILGQDNLFKGLSTFAVEMSELRTILKQSDQNSLVLGDELCSGTESDSALSIFTAGLEILHKKESTFLFATHFHEVNNYSEIKALDKMKMAHMEVLYDKQNGKLIYDRKLKDGPGESMYGLEVCKSLNLDSDFLQRAHDIRMKYNPINKNPLSLTTSHFNSKKIGGLCELCKKNNSTEVHHLAHQNNANKDNQYINSFHKNHIANLINICEECHQNIHKEEGEHKKVKTTQGYEVVLN